MNNVNEIAITIFLIIAPSIAAFIGFKFGQWSQNHDRIIEEKLNQYKHNQN